MFNKINNYFKSKCHEDNLFNEKNKSILENYKNLKENLKKILIIMSPIIPHLANEYLARFDIDKNFQWPKLDKKYLVNDKKLIVIQVNGKKRNTITIENDLSEDELINTIKNNLLISKYLNDGELVKTVYIKDKLINFIIK